VSKLETLKLYYVFLSKCLKINFHKSDIYCIGQAQSNAVAFEEIFTCKVGKLPMKYLGVPIDKKIIILSD
jgi:hypothetical protein